MWIIWFGELPRSCRWCVGQASFTAASYAVLRSPCRRIPPKKTVNSVRFHASEALKPRHMMPSASQGRSPCCRSTFDVSGRRQLGVTEFAELHNFISACQSSFYAFDRDGSRALSIEELAQALHQAGEHRCATAQHGAPWLSTCGLERTLGARDTMCWCVLAVNCHWYTLPVVAGSRTHTCAGASKGITCCCLNRMGLASWLLRSCTHV
jgi:hypothetical protein